MSAPRAGWARFLDGVHAVKGLPANLLVSDALVTRANSVSFSDSGGLVSRTGKIDLVDANAQLIASFASDEAAPVLNMDGALTTAIAWLPSSHSILYWNGKDFAHAEANLAGEVTGIQVTEPDKARLLIRQTNGSVAAVVVSLKTGLVVDSQIVAGCRRACYCATFFSCRRRFENSGHRIRKRLAARAANRRWRSHHRANVLRLAAHFLCQLR